MNIQFYFAPGVPERNYCVSRSVCVWSGRYMGVRGKKRQHERQKKKESWIRTTLVEKNYQQRIVGQREAGLVVLLDNIIEWHIDAKIGGYSEISDLISTRIPKGETLFVGTALPLVPKNFIFWFPIHVM